MFPNNSTNQVYAWWNGEPYLVYNGAMTPAMPSSFNGAPIYAQNYAPSLFMHGMGAPNSMYNYNYYNSNGFNGNFVPDQPVIVSVIVCYDLRSSR